MGRRNFLTTLAAVTGAAVTGATVTQAPTIAHPISLAQLAQQKGLRFGANLGIPVPVADPALTAAFLKDWKMVVAGFYWDFIRPSADEFDFSMPDQWMQFAADHQLDFRGHPLIWYNANPSWLEGKFADAQVKASEMEKLLVDHITTVVKRYAGRVYLWDVVNEGIRTEDGDRDGIARRGWFNALGAEYIELAFHAAAEADPQALLFYNDEGQQLSGDSANTKRTATLKLLEHLKNRNVPIDGFGLQSHLWSIEQPIDQKALQQFLQDVADLGLKIIISELDVIDSRLPTDIHERDRLVAATYEAYLTLVLEQPAVIAINTWGVSDRQTWLSQTVPRSDGSAVRPLPLDHDLQPKPSWDAIARSLRQAAPR
jgi:endo-1,4-beta-xylanase